MKKKIYLTSILFIMAYLCFAQTYQVPSDTIKTKFKFLYIIEFADKPPIATENAFINEMRVISRDELPDSSSREICHLLKIDGVIILKLMPKTKVLTLNELFDLYKIKTKYKKPIIKLDDETIDYPETLLISQSELDGVKIVNSRKGYYINIILKDYYKVKEENKKGGKRVL